MNLWPMADATHDGATAAAPLAEAGAAPPARQGLLWKRVTLVFFGVVSVAFSGSSVAQLIPGVFGTGAHPIPAGAPGSPERVCAQGIGQLARALDRAGPMAGGPGFAAALHPEWDDAAGIQAVCTTAGGGLDAWAALLRLRSAQEQLAGRSPDDVVALRREVASHLPTDLR